MQCQFVLYAGSKQSNSLVHLKSKFLTFSPTMQVGMHYHNAPQAFDYDNSLEIRRPSAAIGLAYKDA